MLFGVHMHQPIDNFNFIIEKAVKRCYEPFFKTLKNYDFKISFHCSGWLFEKIKEDFSYLFDDILYLYDKGQIELFTGGFYEPILNTIPSEDRVAQILMHQDFLKREFGEYAKGLWLTERIWDYAILKDLVKCSIEYVIVDDNHLFKASIKDINGYYITEDEERLAIFAISKNLRYAIPFKEIDYIKKIEDLVHFDDLEKFGLWPYTYKWVYEKGWLDRFFSSFKSYHFKDFLKIDPPLGIAYIKDTSYIEMEEWSGGVFKNFFRKYKESNHLHKRMLQISKKEKSKSLYKLQANDVYWHGIFGGLYLPNLRDNAYRYLIECEKKESEKSVIKDFDFDGKDEIILYEKDYIYIFNHKGELIEFDDKDKKFNFLNTLKRKKEPYHKEIFEEDEKKGIDTIHHLKFKAKKEVKEHLIYDKNDKFSFVDFLISQNFSFINYKMQDFSNYAPKDFDFKKVDKRLIFNSIYLKKEFKIENNKIDFHIKNHTFLDYGIEIAFHFAQDFLVNNKELKEEIIMGGDIEIEDRYTNRKIFINTTANKIYPINIYSVNKSEKGFELILQCVNFLFLFKKEIKGSLKIV